MKHVLVAAATILSLIAVCQERQIAADDPIVVKGTVKEVTAGEMGGRTLAQVLVEVDSKGEYLFLLRKETQISLSNKKSRQWSDLKADQRVSITYNGIVAPTRPPQAGANAIVIEMQPKTKKKR